MFSAAIKTDNVSSAANYIEDVFSTYLYTGTSGSNTITNGIDLSTKGGLVWVKSRSGASSGSNHILQDTVRGANKQLRSNTTGAEGSDAVNWAFNSSGFSMNTSISYLNDSGTNYASWTFREQAKFFDVVTYTGTGSNTTIAHNLGSVPGCIIVKRTDTTADWQVYHRSLANTQYLVLNDTAAAATGATRWNSTTPTSTVFSIGTDTTVNASGGTYVAYLFAHDAGGFGLTGTDNVISCGTFTTDGSGAAGNITLGYESQWVFVKRTDGAGSWFIVDAMRGSSLSSYNYISVNTANAENAQTSTQGIYPTATGFYVGDNLPAPSATYIYISIRRGPMAVPTTGTSVFSPNALTTAPATFNIGFPLDLIVNQARDGGQALWGTRLQGPKQYLDSSSTAAEVTAGTAPWAFDKQNDSYAYYTPISVAWNFRRAPSFFDVVCYTGDGANRTVAHNLTAVPEMMIVKARSGTSDWSVYAASQGASARTKLNLIDAEQTGTFVWNYTAPTSSVFSLGTAAAVNDAGVTFVAYLFATCAGVSKVGSYTGTGALQTVNCGFASGARFVLIKRTDSTGDWYVWDSARGISSGNDPYLLINSIAAEVTGTNYVDTDSTGFKVTAAAPAALNASGGTYIFLAIA